MKNWKPIVYICLALSPGVAFGQANDGTIVKALKDPARPANSAKADVHIQDKKIVALAAPEGKKKKKYKRNPTK